MSHEIHEIMVRGACYPNGSNFQRTARLDVVNRVRRLNEVGLLKERPKWLTWCERVPPIENHNLHLQARSIRSPYPQMVNFLLKKYPDLRFQDCYVDGNDWSAGNDAYRDDHPVMQFVGKQLELMRTEGLNKKEAFSQTEKHFRERRQHLETEQKLMMATAVKAGFQPMFCTGRAYLEVEKARLESQHLQKIIGVLRRSKTEASEEAVRIKLHQVEEPKVLPTDADEELRKLLQPPEEKDDPMETTMETAMERAKEAPEKQEEQDLKAKFKGPDEPEDVPEKQVPPEVEESYAMQGRSKADKPGELSMEPRTDRGEQVSKMLRRPKGAFDEEDFSGDEEDTERKSKREDPDDDLD